MTHYNSPSGETDICDGPASGCDGCPECVPWVCSHGVSGGCRPCIDADDRDRPRRILAELWPGTVSSTAA